MHLSLAIASALLFGSYVAAMPTPPVPPPVTADPNALPIFGAGGPGTPSTPSSGSLFHGSMSPPAPHSPPWRAPISPGAYFPSDAMHDDLNRQPSVASSSHHSLRLQSLQSFPQRQPSTAPSFGQGPQPLTPPGYRHPSTAPSFGQALTPPDHHRHPSAAPSFGQSLSPVPGPSTFPGSAAPGPSTHHQGYPPPPPPPALPVLVQVVLPWVMFPEDHRSPMVPLIVAMVEMVVTMVPTTDFILKTIRMPGYIPRRKIDHMHVKRVVAECASPKPDELRFLFKRQSFHESTSGVSAWIYAAPYSKPSRNLYWILVAYRDVTFTPDVFWGDSGLLRTETFPETSKGVHSSERVAGMSVTIKSVTLGSHLLSSKTGATEALQLLEMRSKLKDAPPKNHAKNRQAEEQARRDVFREIWTTKRALVFQRKCGS
ncbi:hypothetical protein F5887DRAFT_1163681 [Amanita rubescens]|nr:hypothetical protein F5887DRAFT_1163681 [Amanita rubescens]